MATNANAKSNSFEPLTPSYNDVESMSTSPILDTAKVKNRAKLRLKRRTSGDSSNSATSSETGESGEAHKKFRPIRARENAENFSPGKDFDSRPNNVPSPGEPGFRLGGSLVDRLRDLKQRKKARTSQLMDARISDEEFVKSVRLLDSACYSTPPKKSLPSPKRFSGLRSFGEIERLSPSEPNTPTISSSVTHLSLDEDKEEDLFADAKDNIETAEHLEQFSQWKYNPDETSPSSFHGFSAKESSSSRERSQRISLYRERNDLDEDEIAYCRGFSSSITDQSRRLFENWKSLLKKNYPDSRVWADWFVEPSQTHDKIITNDDKKNTINISDTKATKKTKISVDRDNLVVTSETISKTEVATNNIPIIGDTVNLVSSGKWKKRLAAREMIARAEASLSNKIKNNDEKSINDPKLGALSSLRGNCGFSTAGGRPISVSEAAITKAELLLSQASESIEQEPLDNRKNDDQSISQNNCGFLTAGGLPISVSETALAKAEDRFNEENEKISEDLFNVEKTFQKNYSKNSHKKCGFSTASGRPIKLSQTALEKAEALLIEERTNVEDEKMDDKLEDSTDFTITESDKAICKAEDFLAEDTEWINFQRDGEINPSSELASSSRTRNFRDSHESSTFRERPIEISSLRDNKIERSNSVDRDPKKNLEIPSNKKPENTKKSSKINFGFATAGGKELKISEKSWSKAKAAFDAIDESAVVDLVESEKTLESEKNFGNSKIIGTKNKTETAVHGFSTASGRSVEIATKTLKAAEAQFSIDLDNMESIDFDDFVDPVEESEMPKKRKIEDVDEETPLRRDADLKRKRGRYVNDLQARKLFNDDTNNEDEARRIKIESVGTKKNNSDENLIPTEDDAIVAAFLEDEKRTNDKTTLEIDGPQTNESNVSKLGCRLDNRSNTDARNPLGTFNREDVKKVNSDSVSTEDLHHSHDLTFTKSRENNHRAAFSKDESQEIQTESIPDDLTFESQFSQDMQLSPVMDRFIAETIKIMEGRLIMASKQDETIRGKRRNKPESSDGSLYRLRNCNRGSRITWKQLTDGIAPTPREICGDSSARDVLTITADSAERYSFCCADFYGEKNVRRNIEGIKVGDEAFLILDEKNRAGPREFERAFLASPGVDPNLITTGWVRNHYRWIVWKLASMDRVKFGHKCLPRMLTPDRVMLELKYRYDREIYRTQWPPLRRILERGEDASARLVLCVSSIVPEEDANVQARNVSHTPNSMVSIGYKMRLTDGWYSIATSIDGAMINLIKSGKVREGTKLMISGAKVVNLDQGCSAAEVPEAVTLRIYTNSTRRSRWNTKLDYCHKNRGPMSLSLKSVKSRGGAISKMIVAVSRVYPILYREKLPDGQTVFRNARCDEEAALAHEARYQSKMEEIYANAWTEFQIGSMNKKIVGATKSRGCTNEEAEACSRDMEEELRRRISSKMRECLPSPRDVTPVMKLRIAEDDTSALMTVWSTDRDTTELFVEGTSIAVYNAFASGFRANELQITAGRSTFVKREASRLVSYPKRIYTSLADVSDPGFAPVYGEFDTIGVVTSTGPAPHGMKNFDTVNLACPRADDATASDFLSVLFWLGVSSHGYAKILTVGSLVACSNLEWRKNNSRSIPTAYCTERSVFSKNPRQNYLVQPFEIFRNEIKDPHAYAAACATLIEEEIGKKTALRTPGSCVITPYKPSTFDSRTPGWSPRDVVCSNDENCTTPRMDSKKVSMKKRLERLEAYGDAPKLPSIVINNSPRVSSTGFSSPVVNSVKKS